MITGTIIVPVIDKGIVNEIWLDSFIHNFSLNPAEWCLIISNGGMLEHIHQEYISRLGAMQFGHFVCYRRKNWYDKSAIRQPHYVKCGTAIAHAWHGAKPHIMGDIIIHLEDDILFAPHSMEILLNDLQTNPEFGLVAAVQRFRDKSPKHNVIAWKSRRKITDNDHKNQIISVDSTGTGLCVFHVNPFIEIDFVQLVMDNWSSSDIAFCDTIRTQYNKCIAVNGDVEVIHVDQNGCYHGSFRVPKIMSV